MEFKRLQNPHKMKHSQAFNEHIRVVVGTSNPVITRMT